MHPQSQKNGKPSSRPGKMFIVKLLSNTADVVFFWMIINIFLYFKGAKYIVIWYENITVMLQDTTYKRNVIFQTIWNWSFNNLTEAESVW